MIDIVNKIYIRELPQFIWDTVGVYKSKNMENTILKIGWTRYEGFVMDFIPGDRYEDLSIRAIKRVIDIGKWRKTH